MHSPNNTAASSHRQLSRHATRFSFPPTQRTGLLDSTTIAAKRSKDQRVNLNRSFARLLGSLNM